MRQQIQHTPEGLRDIYNAEYEKKLMLQERLHSALHLYGYHDIQTPTFEFFEVFGRDIGSIASKDLYKFFDREGNTLVLRPDITPSIARVAATLLKNEEEPIRLCYSANTFINWSSYQGKLKENTQLGAELIGTDCVSADAEMIALVVDSLKRAGLKEFQIHVGNVDFFQSIIEEAKLSEEVEEKIRELISKHNYFAAEELLKKTAANQSIKECFSKLPQLLGDVTVLGEAKALAPAPKAYKAIERLEQMYQLLKAYDAQGYVTFDLSFTSAYEYYTGIVFRGYTFGTGDAIVRGGRYNNLIKKFGKDTPSIGFAIVVDELMSAFMRQKISIPRKAENILLVYESESEEAAISYAKSTREKGENVELIKREPQKSMSSYCTYGDTHGAKEVRHMQTDKTVVTVK